MQIAVVGATGLVGSEILKVLGEMPWSPESVIAVASARSVGSKVLYKGQEITVVSADDCIAAKPDFAIFSAGGALSLELAPRFAAAGITVVDNSSAWRMQPDVPLVVPEVNGNSLTKADRIIANPNCSTIQMVLVLKPLHNLYKIKRVVVSTYQSVSGSGQKGVTHLMNERAGNTEGTNFYPHPIDLNIIPHIDSFLDNGYTKEEMKMVNETQKIMGEPSIMVTATTVRVPVIGGHSEAVNIEFESDFDLQIVRKALAVAPGLVLQDDPSTNTYPTPRHAHGKNETFVGRLRRDFSQPNTLNCWIVSDNLRKGAATNAVQIVELLSKL